MAEITSAMVKELRDRTSAGMMECKKALVEAAGDMQVAEDIIAKSGHKKAAKSAGRTAAEGRIQIFISANSAIIVEVNCETDFVARDESFIQFCEKVAAKALQEGIQDPEALLAMPLENNQSIEEFRKSLIVRIGENIQIRRLAYLKAGANQRIGQYTHQSRIGALVLLEGGTDELAKELAMHVASMKPRYLTNDEVPASEIDKQKEIFLELAKQSGKPMEIVEKMLVGQLQKHLNEIVLTGQPFFKDPDQMVSAILKAANAKIIQMIRFEVGEGIEVIKKSFEEEVMSAARGSNV